jgi:hypothetical protein
LSSEDRASELKALTVWVSRLTTSEQAHEFLGANKAAYRLVLSLIVGDIRDIRPTPDSPLQQYLDVVWDQLLTEQAGGDGHAGLVGLHSDVQPNKLYRRALRARLADLVNEKRTIEEWSK